jgi:hypothetical protein
LKCRNTRLINGQPINLGLLPPPYVKNVCKKVGSVLSKCVAIGPNTAAAGHFIYECKYERPYISRPSRTQQLENPRVLAKLKADGKPSVEVPEEFKNKSVHLLLSVAHADDTLTTRTGIANKILEAKEKERAKEAKGKEVASSSRKRARYVNHSS